MKKIGLIFLLTIGLSVVTIAQVEPHAIGVRLGGGNYGGGFEASYQHGLGDANRLEFDLGINSYNSSSYFSAVGIYQWIWMIGEGFNWYAGPGAQFLGFKNNAAFGIGGQVGVEYNFNVALETPLQISIYTRPMMKFGSNTNDFGWVAALGIRYTF